jgi:hypothetical protein
MARGTKVERPLNLFTQLTGVYFHASYAAKRLSPLRRTDPKTRLKLLSPGDGGIKSHQLGHAFNRHISGFKQDLAAPQAFGGKPVGDAHSRGFNKMTGQGAAAHRNHLRQRVQAMRFGDVLL